MSIINVVHISDLHASEDKASFLSQISSALSSDIISILGKDRVSLVAFTGDLVSDGANGVAEAEIAFSYFFRPLLKELHLDETYLFLCPGNHDNNLTALKKWAVDGLKIEVSSDINKLESCFKKGDVFDQCIVVPEHWDTGMLNTNVLLEQLSSISQVAIVPIGDVKIGIGLHNTAWSSCGKSSDDKGNLLWGYPEIEKIAEAVKNCNFRILLLHHPTYYIDEFEKPKCESCLSEFDIVLHGHLHKQDSKQQYSPTENTLYLTAGRLDCKEEELSGYSLMQIDTETMEVVVHLRKYYHARKVFDKSLSSAPDGVFTYKLAGMIEKQSTTYQALKLYKDFAKEFIYSDPISLLVSQNNTQGFIVPTLKRRSMLDVPSLDPSSLLKDTQDEDRIELSKVINDNNCYIILGQPKYGKSTILKYFASICLSQQVPNRQIPLFIDMNTLNLQGKKQIFRGLQKSFSEITQNNASIRNSDLSSLLSTNQVLVLVDNLNLLNPRHREVIEIFRNDYVQTKVVLTTNEHTFSAEYSGEGSHFRKNFECVYLHPIDKQSLQTYVNDYLGENITDAEALVDKITHSMQEIGMAKTPFNAMMLLAVLRETTDFNAVNEAVLVERFMELILEKLDFEEIKSDRFDFRNKEDYLSFLAYNLDYINRSSFSEDEYEALVKKYFQQTGFDRNASDFDKLFFSKNILAKEDGEIFFTSSFIPEYYLAKYYLVSGLPEKLSKDLVYLNYTNELVFYAGLKRKDIEVFSTIENDFRGMVQARIDKDEYLVDFTPRVDIDFSEELIKPTSTDRAMITDVPDLGISSNSLELQKKRNRELLPDSQADSTFIYALYLYSKLLRNYEYLSPQEKIDAIKTCILGTNHLIFSFAHAFSEMINTELPLMKGDFESDSVAPEMIERKLNKIANTLYTSVPVTIQTVVATWFASKKLIPQFEKIHHIKELANMNAFIFYAILLDMDTSYEAISSYIKNEPNKNMLRLLYLKFQTSYYYATSKSDENNLFNLIYAIQKKLNPKKMSHSGADEFVDKSKLLKNLKDEKAKKTRFGFPL